MTQRREHFYRIRQNSQGMVLAGCGTITAKSTSIQINPGDQNRDIELLPDLRFQEYATVWLFHITIKITDIPTHSGNDNSQVGGYRRLPRTTFTASN